MNRLFLKTRSIARRNNVHVRREKAEFFFRNGKGGDPILILFFSGFVCPPSESSWLESQSFHNRNNGRTT